MRNAYRKRVSRTALRASRLACAWLLSALALPVQAQEIRGRVVIEGWAEAGAGAEVTLLDRVLAALATVRADDAGRFSFPRLAAGTYHVQAALGGRSSALSPSLVLGAGVDTAEVELLVPSPLLVAALDCLREGAAGAGVLVGTAYETGTRLPIPGAELQAATERGTRVADLVRDRFPLSVREGNFVTTENDLPRGMVCIEGRRADRLTVVTEDFALPAAAAAALRGFAFCDMILVVIDGNEVPGGGDVLLGITAADFESVEYLPPIEAGTRYGLHAGIQGALALWTRGRGPHARRER